MQQDMYFGLDGKPIDMMTWAKMQLPDFKRIAEDTIEVGGRRWWVSTVWMGLDHNFGIAGPPLIFETMVFDADTTKVSVTDGGDWSDLMMDRYATKEQALAGHRLICDAVRTMAETGLPTRKSEKDD